MPAGEGKEEKGNMNACPIKIKSAINPVLDTNVLHVDPLVMKHLKELANAHGRTVDEMGNIMLRRILNPDGRPLES